MQITATRDLQQLVTLTAPGAPVGPAIAKLDDVVQSIRAARPALAQARAGAELLDELDRIQGSAATLRNALADLIANDGMTTFDPAFSQDDASWDAWFTASAKTLAQAEQA
jgi:hypothetical protein